MRELIDRQALLDEYDKAHVGPPGKARKLIEDAPTVPRWHRVEDGLPEMSEIVPGYVCSKTLVLYDAESGHMDIGYVREKPNGVDWIWGEPFENPTHWMPIEPPKED